MITELNNEDILNFLMTSDLEDQSYSQSELKYLYFKWRYFYRILHGNSERLNVEMEGNLKSISDRLKSKEAEVQILQVKLAEKQNIIDGMKNRELSLKERIRGKIILKDENK